MKERTSASDEKYHNNLEILPYIVVNIRQVIKGCIFPLTHRHLFTNCGICTFSGSNSGMWPFDGQIIEWVYAMICH